MALASSVSGQTVVGDLRMVWGTFTSDTTTGDINTGLTSVFTMAVTAKGSSIVADAPTINETFPLASGDVTVICTTSTVGYWVAWGK
jgi:hypothetical protein